ncbi:MAG TPA: hypothetical protein VMT80_01640 [Candidatus Paceibacterota bacterium]|nr:hypothetical protein [Candidatus Paceibacterota bacterium]
MKPVLVMRSAFMVAILAMFTPLLCPIPKKDPRLSGVPGSASEGNRDARRRDEAWNRKR